MPVGVGLVVLSIDDQRMDTEHSSYESRRRPLPASHCQWDFGLLAWNTCSLRVFPRLSLSRVSHSDHRKLSSASTDFTGHHCLDGATETKPAMTFAQTIKQGH